MLALREEGSGPEPEDTEAVVLDAVRFPYREHGDGRTIALLEARLERRGESGGELVLHASAVDPLVTPPRGFRYLRGENPITAREMRDLVADDGEPRGLVVTRDASGDEFARGGLAIAGLHRYGERVLLPDGTLDDVGARREPLPAAIRHATGTLPAGDWESALVLDGVPRLRVRFAFDADGGRIEALEAEHPEDQEDLP